MENTTFESGWIYFNRDFGQPIFEFDIVSSSPAPCYANGAIPYQDTPYNAFAETYGCATYGQDGYIDLIASIDEPTLYNVNGMNNTMASLPDYLYSIEGNTINLVTRKKELLSNPMTCQYNTSAPTSLL